jgi:hypothetical protein
MPEAPTGVDLLPCQLQSSLDPHPHLVQPRSVGGRVDSTRMPTTRRAELCKRGQDAPERRKLDR